MCKATKREDVLAYLLTLDVDLIKKEIEEEYKVVGELADLANGKKAPYVGNICMDVCMIDVTDIDCREGDQAVIFGDELPITVLSDTLDTIPYEVLTGISTRVKRVYYQD